MTIDDILITSCMTRDMLTGYVRGYMRTMPEGTIMPLPINDAEGTTIHDAFYGLKLGPVSYRFADNKAELEKTRMLYNVTPPLITGSPNAAVAAANASSAIAAANAAISDDKWRSHCERYNIR